MDYPLPPAQADLQGRLLAFVRDEIEPIARGVDPERVPADVARTIAARAEAAGFYRLPVPRKDGGEGAGPLTLTAAREALALSGHPLANLALSGGPGLMRLANNDRQRADLYTPVLRGEKRTAFGFTEPQGAERTRAERDPANPDQYLVTGAKAFVTGGPECDWIILLANVPESEGQPGGAAIFVVDRTAPGVTQGGINTTMDGTSHCPFTFDQTPVPASRMLGEIGQGMPSMLRGIREMRLGVAAQSVGWARWVNRFTLEKIERPHRSGAPLAEREQIQAIFADMVAETFAAQSTLYRVALEAEAGRDDPAAVATAKILATETLGRVVDRAIQLYGGLALARGHELERLYRVARTLRIAEGTTEILRLNITRDIRARGAAAL